MQRVARWCCLYSYSENYCILINEASLKSVANRWSWVWGLWLPPYNTLSAFVCLKWKVFRHHLNSIFFLPLFRVELHVDNSKIKFCQHLTPPKTFFEKSSSNCIKNWTNPATGAICLLFPFAEILAINKYWEEKRRGGWSQQFTMRGKSVSGWHNLIINAWLISWLLKYLVWAMSGRKPPATQSF